MILIDPPAWPAHGALWSHLVSDTSLRELRTFARDAGLPDGGFDLDHYDVPDRRHADLVAAGASPVDGGTLARRLGASGLRVPGRERSRASGRALAARWAGLAPTTDAHDAPDPAWAGVGGELISRWREPHRVYHSRLHLAAALDAVDLLLAGSGSGPRSGTAGDDDEAAAVRNARLAVWFHDAVHDGDPVRDEERSAALAVELLGSLPTSGWLRGDDVAEVERLVLLTATHDPADGDPLGALVSDADLAVLGADPARYARYVEQVRAEYAHVPDAAFHRGRADVLEGLLGLPSLYRTPTAQAAWGERATVNLSTELAGLTHRRA